MDPAESSFKRKKFDISQQAGGQLKRERESLIDGFRSLIKPDLEALAEKLVKRLKEEANRSRGGAVRLEGFEVSLIASFAEGSSESAKAVLTSGDDYHGVAPVAGSYRYPDSGQQQRKCGHKNTLYTTNWRVINTKPLRAPIPDSVAEEVKEKKRGKDKSYLDIASSSAIKPRNRRT